MAGKLSTEQWISREEDGFGGKSGAEEAEAEAELGGCGWTLLTWSSSVSRGVR